VCPEPSARMSEVAFTQYCVPETATFVRRWTRGQSVQRPPCWLAAWPAGVATTRSAPETEFKRRASSVTAACSRAVRPHGGPWHSRGPRRAPEPGLREVPATVVPGPGVLTVFGWASDILEEWFTEVRPLFGTDGNPPPGPRARAAGRLPAARLPVRRLPPGARPDEGLAFHSIRR
jgi:hypothetical protein